MLLACPGDILESKPGIFERIRRALGGSPSDHDHGQSGHIAAAQPYQQQLDLLCDTARDLCADTWLANQISLEVKNEGGKKALHYLPAESMPYVKAAYAIRKKEMPSEMQSLFENAAS